jgi:hypothetical protein
MLGRGLTACAVAMLIVHICPADPPQPRFVGLPIPIPGTGPADELSGALRGLILRSLPNPLLVKKYNWGKQRPAPILRDLRNDGLWQEIEVTAVDPYGTLVFDIRSITTPEPNKLHFILFASLDVRVRYRRQRWESGARLFSGETRARARVKLALACEAVAKLESKPGSILPDAVIKLHALGADLRYDNLVVEHTAGVGGDMARMVGEAFHGILGGLRPSLEEELLQKGNAAIVKALDHREVRVGLSKAFNWRPSLKK